MDGVVRRRTFLALALLGGPAAAFAFSFAFGVSLDRWAEVVAVFGVLPAAVAWTLGLSLRRPAKEVALAGLGATAITFAVVVFLVLLFLLTVPDDFFN